MRDGAFNSPSLGGLEREGKKFGMNNENVGLYDIFMPCLKSICLNIFLFYTVKSYTISQNLK